MKAGRLVKAMTGLTWVVVLGVILGVSAYSLFYVMRHWHVPPLIAAAMSTCFDGTALIMASFSVKYAQQGLSGSRPRAMVWVAAGIAAFLQTFHARLGHEPPGAWVGWASLPIFAAILYDTALRWERLKALARAGRVYPAPLPNFGLVSWLLFPLNTLTSVRKIVGRRIEAMIAHAQDQLTVSTSKTEPAAKTHNTSKPANTPADTSKPANRPESAPAAANVASLSTWASRNAPKRHIRAWAKVNGYPQIGDRARIPRAIEDAYHAAHAEGDGADRAEQA